jgi:hypothetical protein
MARAKVGGKATACRLQGVDRHGCTLRVALGKTKRVDVAWPFVPPLGSLKESKAVLAEVHHGVLAPMTDKKPAGGFLFLMALLFGIIVAPEAPFLARVRDVALLIFQNDANLMVLAQVTVAIHVGEVRPLVVLGPGAGCDSSRAQATLAVVLARRLKLRFQAVVGWAVCVFFVGGASLKPLAELAFATAASE